MPSPEHLLLALTLDLVIGDPRRLPHPVQLIGLLISLFERLLHRWRQPWISMAAGLATVLLAAAVPTIAVVLALSLLPQSLAALLSVYLVFSFLALRSLDDHARRTAQALIRGDLESARSLLSRIVGRDCASLDQQGVMRALIETVSENLSDGLTAPLFWLAVGGVPAMTAYKCVNTLDSMIGYRNPRYLHFGKAAARLDDAANLLPARLTAMILLLAAAVLPGLSSRKGWRILLRDRRRHSSPNAGFPEAAAAGALGVRLGGPSFYAGKRVEKPWIGDEDRPASCQLWPLLRRLLYLSAFVAYALTAAVLWLRT